MSAPHLFDRAESIVRRDEAIGRVGRAMPFTWAETCRQIIVSLPDEWTTDDVWRELDRLGVPVPKEPRAMGAVIRPLARRGVIVATGQYRRSERAEAHRNPKAVWQTQRETDG